MAKRELKKPIVDELIVDAVEETNVDTVEETTVEVVEEKKEEPVKKVEVVTGVVVNCSKLNIRKKANVNSDVVLVVNAGSKLTIDLDKSNGEWFKVTAGNKTRGYCMKKFVSIDG